MASRAPHYAATAAARRAPPPAIIHDDEPPPPYTVLEESETAALLGGGRHQGHEYAYDGVDADVDAALPQRRAPGGGPRGRSPRSSRSRRTGLLPLSNLTTVFLACILGTFLSTCPLPRQSLSQLPRLALMTLCASLVTLLYPSSVSGSGSRRRRRRLRRDGTAKKPIGARRLAAAYLGLYLAAYALFGLAEEVGFETSSVPAVVFGHRTAAVGLQPGYVARAVVVVVGFALQRLSGLFSTWRILATYLLLLAWVYADAPITLISLATGRKHW